MKAIILFIALLCGAVAQETLTAKGLESVATTATTGDWTLLSSVNTTTAYTMTFPCGIVVNPNNGEVTIPKGLAITDASREFWTGLASAYPHAFPHQYAARTDAEEVADIIQTLMRQNRILITHVRGITDLIGGPNKELVNSALDYAELNVEYAKPILAKWQKRAKGEQP